MSAHRLLDFVKDRVEDEEKEEEEPCRISSAEDIAGEVVVRGRKEISQQTK